MSFVDLATLALHRRTEMEARINVLVKKCDQAITDIGKLKLQGQSFVQQLNCEPAELKERFLNCMKQLDEYIYLITDFNLSIGQLEELGSIDYTPVHDTSRPLLPAPAHTLNIMDILSEPTPSTSTACPNFCPAEKLKRKRVPKEEQTLIQFSSSSCSAESMPMVKNDKEEVIEKKEMEIQCDVVEGVSKITITDPPLPVASREVCNLPAQTVLQTENVYPATIMSIDGASFWVITDDNDAYSLMLEMTQYYKDNRVEMSVEAVKLLTYCAFYDDDSDGYYRGLFIRLNEDTNEVEVFLVDTGEVRSAKCEPGAVQPLAARFCEAPPYARCCHLAGVDLLSYQDNALMEKEEALMKTYMGTRCTIEVDDNTSESLGVYVTLPNKEILNDILVQQGLAVATDTGAKTSSPTRGPPELADLSGSDLDMSKCHEYDDPLEAVTGYSCRDEADICKHYKGGPDKTCFKGARCKKRHVLKHPDGWTLDRVEVARCRAVPLPAPGTWHKVLVTCVCHYDRLYVQFVKEKVKEELPCFGVVLPPTTLDALVKDMNSPATRMAYKPLTMAPAPFELVAALYPLDDQWYRARVISSSRVDQNVEVMYVDYGNVVWVREDAVRQLEARHTALPAQAALCALAGVAARSHDSRQWADAKRQLAAMTQDRVLDAHIIARDYDEVTVELYDSEGYNIAEQLAAFDMIELKEYAVMDDTHVRQKIVVP